MRELLDVTAETTSCDQLVRQVFRLAQGGGVSDGGRIVLVTAAHRGAGVSYITELLSEALNAEQPGSALSIASSSLLAPRAGGRAAHNGHGSFTGGRSGSGAELHPANLHNPHEALPGKLRELARRHSHVFIDTPSLKQSSDILSFCPLASGVIVVVEANKTNRHQLDLLERTIADASGTVLGLVLNKRSYPIPAWFNDRLERLGI